MPVLIVPTTRTGRCIQTTVSTESHRDVFSLAFPCSLPFPIPSPKPRTDGSRGQATLSHDPIPSSLVSPRDRKSIHLVCSTSIICIRFLPILLQVFDSCFGGWSQDDNAGVTVEEALLRPPRRSVARRSRRTPRLRRRTHRRAPPSRRGLPPEVRSR